MKPLVANTQGIRAAVGYVALSDGLYFDIRRLREIARRNAQRLGLVDRAAPQDPDPSAR